ncbi:MAG TPA: hypothetical protein DCL21_01425 [Alphaproteobacteria bacterium]|nr:hypothetical protein [Alphaproteobacteria bacterium]
MKKILIATLSLIITLSASTFAYYHKEYDKQYELYLGIKTYDNDVAYTLLAYFAENNNPKALYELGTIHQRNGELEEALKVYKKSAELGYTEAQLKLAYIYRFEQEKYEEAIEWYRKAAEKGNSLAQISLATIYERGKITQQNYAESFRWYKKLADKDPHFLKKLAKMYEYGKGTKENKVKAYAIYYFDYIRGRMFDIYYQIDFYNLSILDKEEKAKRNLDRLKRELTKEEVYKARLEASKYFERLLESSK